MITLVDLFFFIFILQQHELISDDCCKHMNKSHFSTFQVILFFNQPSYDGFPGKIEEFVSGKCHRLRSDLIDKPLNFNAPAIVRHCFQNIQGTAHESKLPNIAQHYKTMRNKPFSKQPAINFIHKTIKISSLPEFYSDDHSSKRIERKFPC